MMVRICVPKLGTYPWNFKVIASDKRRAAHCWKSPVGLYWQATVREHEQQQDWQ